MSATSSTNLSSRIESGINKCFLILDQIDETIFPLLDEAIFARNNNEIAKLDFVVQHRIQAVERDCDKIHKMFNVLLRSELDSVTLESITNRIQQLKFEQKRIQRSYHSYQLKVAEKNRKEREEDILTRRITTTVNVDTNLGPTTGSQSSSNDKKNYVTLDLSHNSTAQPDGLQTGHSSGLKSPSKISRNHQKTLVKRVRTRYLNLSNHFVETSKLFFGPGVGDWILFFAVLLVITTAIFCVVIWNTSPSRQ